MKINYYSFSLAKALPRYSSLCPEGEGPVGANRRGQPQAKGGCFAGRKRQSLCLCRSPSGGTEGLRGIAGAVGQRGTAAVSFVGAYRGSGYPYRGSRKGKGMIRKKRSKSIGH